MQSPFSPDIQAPPHTSFYAYILTDRPLTSLTASFSFASLISLRASTSASSSADIKRCETRWGRGRRVSEGGNGVLGGRKKARLDGRRRRRSRINDIWTGEVDRTGGRKVGRDKGMREILREEFGFRSISPVLSRHTPSSSPRVFSSSTYFPITVTFTPSTPRFVQNKPLSATFT